MKIVFCYFDNVNYEARGAEELECMSKIGDVSFVSYAKPQKNFSNVICYTTKKRSYFHFLMLGMKIIKKVKPDIVFLHDNYCALFIPYIRRVSKKTKIVYDMSELYIGGHIKEKHRLINRIMLNYPEYRYLRSVDVVMAANIERAYVAKGYYALRDIPIVFDNIHRIDDVVDIEDCDSKFAHLFLNGKFTIMYAGGFGYKFERDIIGLMRTFDELDSSYQLLIAGTDDNDLEIHEIYENNRKNKKNIHYLGRLKRSELKYLYDNSQVNAVLFSPTMINTIYCASGKLYEGFFSGLPALLSNNPTHHRLSRELGVGELERNGCYTDAIIKIRENYDFYKKNVSDFVQSIDYDNRLENLKKEIIERLGDIWD